MRRRADDKRSGAVQYPSMLTGSPPDRDRRAVRMTLLALGAVEDGAVGARPTPWRIDSGVDRLTAP